MTGKRNGDPIWIDLGTDNMDAAAKFYGELFGWTFNDQGADYGHYHMITLGDRPVGGAMSSLMGPEDPLEEPAYPSAWTVLFSLTILLGKIACLPQRLDGLPGNRRHRQHREQGFGRRR